MNSLPKRAPSEEIRNRVFKVMMLGVALPAGILLALRATRYSLFPGNARILWGVLDVAVFGVLLLNAVWNWMDRRAKQA